MADEIVVTDKDTVRLLELNRPDSLNALTDTMRRSIQEAVEEFDREDDLRALVLTGRGRGFCSGADLAANQPVTNTTRRQAKQPRFWWHMAFANTEKPTICALNGTVAGGGLGLAFSCDIVIAAQSARLHPAFMRVALPADNGVAHSLVRRVGYSKALLFLLRGEPLDADVALSRGFVDEVVPDDQLMDAAFTLAGTVAAAPAVAVELTKRLLRDSATLDRRTALIEEEVFINLARATEDAAEGVTAFRERRAPEFKGR